VVDHPQVRPAESEITVREPSLEMHKAVDLSPFFRDYEALQARMDDEAGRSWKCAGATTSGAAGRPSS
jgi:hypothetical protein